MPWLENTLNLATGEEKEVLILGDLNCDLLSKRDASAECKQLKTVLRCLNFTQLINVATRIAQNSSTLLDIVASNCPQNISSSGVASAGLSDHEMVFCVRKLNSKRAPAEIKVFRNYANYDPKKFCQEMESVDWDSLGNSNGQDEPPTTINDVWSNFRSAFLTVADKHAPFIQKRVRGINNCPWMNKEIKSDIRQRDFCLRKARKSNTNEDWSNYRCMRNRVTSKIKKARSAFNRKLVERNSEDPKAFWRTVKKILPGESKSASLSMKIDGDVCVDKKKIADGFNKFFTGAVQRLLQEFGQIKDSAVNQSEPRVSGNKSYPEFKFQLITQNFTLSELKNLKCNKSSGMDNIPPRLLKDAAAVIA